MAQVQVVPNKTYKTHANAVKAVEKVLCESDYSLRWFITCTPDGRFFPVFVGESACHAGMHFHFNCVN